MSDHEPVGGEEQGCPVDVAPRPLDKQDLELLEAVGLDTSDVPELVRKVLARLSPRTKHGLLWSVGNWPGRVTFRCAAGLRHLQIFDRAMTIAAQLFTSVFPIIIMAASLAGGRNAADAIGGAGLPPEAEDVLDDVVTSGASGTFGVIGALVVLISATSLARALTRTYDAIWEHGRTRLSARGTWRWLAAVMTLALSVVVSHQLVGLGERVPPDDLWDLLAVFGVPTVIACYVPWMLMAGSVQVRLLLPGAVMFGVVMLIAHPISERYLANSIAVSAERFGPIGVAFTYLTYLYCVSWVLLGTAVLGRVIVIDSGVVGRVIRGKVTLASATGTGGDDDEVRAAT